MIGKFAQNRTDLSVLVAAFEGYLVRERAPRTVRKYHAVLSDFERAFKGRAIHRIRAGDIDGYLTQWAQAFQQRHGRLPKPVTIRNVISALKAFFEYLDRLDYLTDQRGRAVKNPMNKIRLPKRACKPINWLKPDEDSALLACPGSESERIVVWLLRHTGLRVGEARALRISDFELQPGHERLHVLASKTSAGIRTVPIAPELVPRIHDWLDHLRSAGLYHPDTPFLCTKNGTAMQSTQIWRVVKRMAARANVQVIGCTCGTSTANGHAHTCPRSVTGDNRSKVTPHTLRRTFASSLYNNDLQLDRISKLLGHSSTRVTEEAYAALNGEKLEADYRNALRRRAA